MNQLLGDLAWIHTQLPRLSEKWQYFCNLSANSDRVGSGGQSEEEATASPQGSVWFDSQGYAPVSWASQAEKEQWKC